MLKIRTIKNAIKIGYWAYKNPLVLQAHNFKILSELFAMIMKVASENRPMMVHIGMVQLTETPDKAKMPPLVSIWAGAGSGAEPLKRIQELLSEIDLLKNTLAKVNRDQQQQLPAIKKTALYFSINCC